MQHHARHRSAGRVFDRSQQLHVAEAVEGEPRLVHFRPTALERVLIGAAGAAKVGGVDLAVGIEDLGEPQLRQAKEFRDGEEFLYLGQRIPLTVTDDQLVPLSYDGTFRLSRKHHHKAKAVMINWYREHAKAKIGERLQYYSSEHNIPFGSFRITALQGSSPR